MVVDFIKWYIQLAEHCKQATTKTLTTETIFVIVRLTISILIVVGTCHVRSVCRKAARVRVSRQSLRAGTASN